MSTQFLLLYAHKSQACENLTNPNFSSYVYTRFQDFLILAGNRTCRPCLVGPLSYRRSVSRVLETKTQAWVSLYQALKM